MRIVVVGCGKIGKTIIESLVKEKHEVYAIDSKMEVVEEVRNAYDIISYCGNGTDYESLSAVDTDKCELFIAVTGSDEFNMLACFCAKRMGAKYTVARIRDSENNEQSLAFYKSNLDISMVINPEKLAAEAMFNILKLPSATKVENFSRRGIEMIEVVLKNDSPLDGVSLVELRKKHKEKFLIATVCRGEEVFIPGGDFCLKSGDRIGIVTLNRGAQKVLSALGIHNVPIKDVMLLGAGKTSNYLTKMLVAGRVSVKLIECDPKVCEAVCETLPEKVTVINGNGMSQELLIEEGVLETDAFVSLTGRDEDNILISFYALSKKVPKVICKVNNNELSMLAENLGLDCILSPRKIVADVMVKYARALENSMDSQIETLFSVSNGMAELLEFKVLEDFEYVNIPLKEMKLNKNILVAGISRGNQAIIPTGDDVIMTGDNVIVIAEGARVLSLSDIIER